MVGYLAVIYLSPRVALQVPLEEEGTLAIARAVPELLAPPALHHLDLLRVVIERGVRFIIRMEGKALNAAT